MLFRMLFSFCDSLLLTHNILCKQNFQVVIVKQIHTITGWWRAQ